MKKSIVCAVLWVGVLSLGSFGSLRAEDTVSPAAGDKEGHHACRAEAEKLCPGLKPGEGLGKCVDEHLSELSAQCQEHHKKMKAMHEAKKEGRKEAVDAAKEACAADHDKFCKGLEPGKGLFKCMKEHESELSEGCKSAVASMKEHMPKHGKGGHMGKSGDASASAPAAK